MKAIITIKGISKTKIIEREFKNFTPLQAMLQKDNRVQQWIIKEYNKAVEKDFEQIYGIINIEMER